MAAVFKVGDIVTRKSYGHDMSFKIVDILNKDRSKPTYVLRGLQFRIHADCAEDDLQLKNPHEAYRDLQNIVTRAKQARYMNRRGFPGLIGILSKMRSKPGKILHIDSSSDYLDICTKHYNDEKITSYGRLADESQQPKMVRSFLEQYRPDILVVTGHDGIKKGSDNLNNLDSYWNSKYYIQSVKEARKFEPSADKLCIFAGACQSYYEALMDAGANFASSPGRILINALDPAIVSERVALTDQRYYVTPQEVASLTVSGSKGIGGIRTKGHMIQ